MAILYEMLIIILKLNEFIYTKLEFFFILILTYAKPLKLAGVGGIGIHGTLVFSFWLPKLCKY
jgi:hypothetical protein